MKPVYQTQLGSIGNCYAACLASVLEIDIAEIPSPKVGDLSSQERWDAYQQHVQDVALTPRGLCTLSIRALPDDHFVAGYALAGYRLHVGDGLHSVVVFDGEIVHDPYPGGIDLAEINDYIVIYQLDPAVKYDASRAIR